MSKSEKIRSRARYSDDQEREEHRIGRGVDESNGAEAVQYPRHHGSAGGGPTSQRGIPGAAAASTRVSGAAAAKLISMGFDASKVRDALSVSNWSVDDALEYLLAERHEREKEQLKKEVASSTNVEAQYNIQEDTKQKPTSKHQGIQDATSIVDAVSAPGDAPGGRTLAEPSPEGFCRTCGTKVCDIRYGGLIRGRKEKRLVPLTIPGTVHMGRCLHCHPDRPGEIPSVSTAAAASAAAAATQRTSVSGKSSGQDTRQQPGAFLVPPSSAAGSVAEQTTDTLSHAPLQTGRVVESRQDLVIPNARRVESTVAAVALAPQYYNIPDAPEVNTGQHEDDTQFCTRKRLLLMSIILVFIVVAAAVLATVFTGVLKSSSGKGLDQGTGPPPLVPVPSFSPVPSNELASATTTNPPMITVPSFSPLPSNEPASATTMTDPPTVTETFQPSVHLSFSMDYRRQTTSNKMEQKVGRSKTEKLLNESNATTQSNETFSQVRFIPFPHRTLGSGMDVTCNWTTRSVINGHLKQDKQGNFGRVTGATLDKVQVAAFQEGVCIPENETLRSSLHVFSVAEAIECLSWSAQNQDPRIIIAGDSYNWQLFVGLADILLGDPSDVELTNSTIRMETLRSARNTLKSRHQKDPSFPDVAFVCLLECYGEKPFLNECSKCINAITAKPSYWAAIVGASVRIFERRKGNINATANKIEAFLANSNQVTFNSMPFCQRSKIPFQYRNASHHTGAEALYQQTLGHVAPRVESRPFIDFFQLTRSCVWNNCSFDGGHRSRFVNRWKAQLLLNTICEYEEALQPPFGSAIYGSFGPAGTDRHHYRYYDRLYSFTLQFGQEAKHVLEVGCAQDSFLKHLDWIPKKQCVAPYFVKYSAKQNDGNSSVEFIAADFYDWQPPIYYDLLICSQVAEHVEDPKTFVRKLLDSARTCIVSVPYNWGPSKTANHKTHYIDLNKVLEWTSPRKPAASTIVKDGPKKRLIVVFLEGEKY